MHGVSPMNDIQMLHVSSKGPHTDVLEKFNVYRETRGIKR